MIFKQRILPLLLSTVWIGLSEFVRNQLILGHTWEDHYNLLGLQFPNEPLNGAVWGVWSFVLAVLIFMISRRFNIFETFVIAWVSAFVLLWLVIGNLGVLPPSTLFYALPLSMLEVYGATWITVKLAP